MGSMGQGRPWRVGRAGQVVLGVLALLGVAGGAGAAWTEFASRRRLARVYEIAPVSTVADSAGDPVRGEHLVRAIGACTTCHGADLGGDPPLDSHVASLAPANLTTGRGGVMGNRSTQDLHRAIRHGIRRDGTPLLLMPAEAYTGLSDHDFAAVVAYLRTLPPVDRQVGASRLGPIGRALLAVGRLKLPAEEIDHAAPHLVETPTDTIALGGYLTRIAGCQACHLPTFTGRATPIGPPGSPRPPAILPDSLHGWTEADFIAALRTGQRPDGRPLDQFMPWMVYRGMTDTELRAIWRYLRTVPSGGERGAPRRARRRGRLRGRPGVAGFRLVLGLLGGWPVAASAQHDGDFLPGGYTALPRDSAASHPLAGAEVHFLENGELLWLRGQRVVMQMTWRWAGDLIEIEDVYGCPLSPVGTFRAVVWRDGVAFDPLLDRCDRRAVAARLLYLVPTVGPAVTPG